MISSRAPGASDGTDHGARLHSIPCLDGISKIVGVDSDEAVSMRDLHDPAVRGLPATEEYDPSRRRSDGLTLRGLDVNPAVPFPEAAAEP
jgi:hypothetical protein